MTVTRTHYVYQPRRYTYLEQIRQLRLALFNWCLARSTDGQFVVELEDARYEVPEAQVRETLGWLGLDWDEGPDIDGPYAPYVQSERTGVYDEIVQLLVQSGDVYYCDCNSGRLETLRVTPKGYDNHCRTRNVPRGPGTVLRLKLPEYGTTVVADALRGAVTFDYGNYADPIIVTGDGAPTKQFIYVVDDHHMEITHVLREDNLLSSLPVHMALYAALGWTPPLFVHLPAIWERSSPDNSASYPISTLRDQGYLPEAVLNYLALLGWDPSVAEEIFSPQEIVEQFTLDHVTTSSVEFDRKRLDWFNQQHMQRLSIENMLELVVPPLLEIYPDHESLRDPAWAGSLIDTVRQQISTPADVLATTRFAFADPNRYSPEALAEFRREFSAQVLAVLRDSLPAEGDLSIDAAEDLLKELRKQFKQSQDLGNLQVTQPIRAALTGSLEGPQLPSIISLLGAETCRRRIDHALQQLTVSGS